MNNEEKFIELAAHFIIQRRSDLMMKKFKPYLTIFLILSLLCLLAPANKLVALVYLVLISITVIAWIKSYRDAKRESNEEWGKLSKELPDNTEITQTEFLYNLWKGNI